MSFKESLASREGIRIGRTEVGLFIEGIPGDSEKNLVLNISWRHGDLFISIENTSFDNLASIPEMRFREGAGGTNLPMVAEEFSVINRLIGGDIEELTGEISMDRKNDCIKSWYPVKISIGTKDDNFKYRITDIIDDDQSPNEPPKFMDIEIAKNGTAIVTMRNTRFNVQMTMVFNTEKDGGKAAILAKVFGNIAERIVHARQQ